MFKRIKLRIQDMKTITKLISGADEQANILGEEEPGAEHFVLSALNLNDGTAKRVFEKIGKTPDTFLDAIKKQYHDALSSVGINHDSIDTDPEPIESTKKFPNSKPSGQAVMKLLHTLKQADKDRPILGAHILRVVANMEYGVVARAFKTMGIERHQLAEAAEKEIENS